MKFTIFHSHCRRDEFHESLTAGRFETCGTIGTRGTRPSGRPCERGFTMIEIAICLAIIGFALVVILEVLPLGLRTQQDNREETVIGQDASMLLETIRSGSRGANDLTNYVYAITNYWTRYKTDGTVDFPGTDGFTYNAASLNGTSYPYYCLTNGARIVGVLSTPEFTSGGQAISDTFGVSYTSNRVVAYVHSMSGLAAEKPPQDNQLMRDDTFSYRLVCVNAPMALIAPPIWQARAYNAGDLVSFILNGQATYWQATVATSSGDVPNASPNWARILYSQQLAANLRELRLTFLWAQRPNGSLGPGRQTFRATVAGQLVTADNVLYYYQPQSFYQQ